MTYGKIKDAIYDRSVRRPLKAVRDPENASSRDFEHLNMGDCAVTSAGAAVSGSWEGSTAQAVSLAMGRAAAAGSNPEYVNIQIFWPQDAEEKQLKTQIAAAAALCEKQQVKVGGCDVSCIPGMAQPAVSVMAFGRRASLFEAQPASADEDLIMVGFGGLGGSLRLLAEEKEKLYGHFNPAFFEDMPAVHELCMAEAAGIGAKAGVKTMQPCGEGGIFTGIWEIARQSGLGVQADLKKVLLRQETVEICDYLGVSPYRIPSDGALLMTALHGQKVLEAFAAADIPAAVIGHMTGDNDRVIINEEEVRFLEPFRGEEALS